MIAVSFLDALTPGHDITGELAPQRFAEVADLAKRCVESALADWQRVLECEEQFCSTTLATPADRSRVNRALYEVYQKWATEAEQLLTRIRQLVRSGCAVENAEALEDAFGHVQARLGLTPEMIDRAIEQIHLGQCIPMEELRKESRTRVRK